MREALLQTVVLFGTASLVVTEVLGAFHLLNRPAIAAVWVLFWSAALLRAGKRVRKPQVRLGLVTGALLVAIAGIVLTVAVTAALSPPNTFDALAYHMPRIIYWAQARSVDFFPTSFLHQISFPPLAEYLLLHTYVLSGGDSFVNLVTWAAFAVSIAGASAIAGAMGACGRGQWMAAFFCATLPGAILQASGPKNDCVLALWLICAAYFGLRANVLFTALSFGLAIATKGTAYLFAPGLLAAILFIERRRLMPMLGATLAAVVLLNAPHYWRNLELSGSPLGFKSPFANRTFEVENDPPGWQATVSNVLRNVSAQVGGRSQPWNQAVYSVVVRLHEGIGLDPQDPKYTWQGSRYGPPENTRHEANANNRWHLLILLGAALLCGRDRQWSIYCAGLLAGFLAFCFYLRWQPYGARLLVPLFVLGAPLAGVALTRLRPKIIALAVCVLLLDSARLPLLENWIRPLRGPGSVFAASRESRYFADIQSMKNQASYMDAVDLVARSGCRIVGVDISRNQLEYPFQALLLRRNPDTRFQHTGVDNPSLRYRDPATPQPCAVLCLDCAGDDAKLGMYGHVSPPRMLGRFLLFMATRHQKEQPVR